MWRRSIKRQLDFKTAPPLRLYRFTISPHGKFFARLHDGRTISVKLRSSAETSKGPVCGAPSAARYRSDVSGASLRVAAKAAVCEGKWERGEVIPTRPPLPIVWRPENSPDASADTLPANCFRFASVEQLFRTCFSIQLSDDASRVSIQTRVNADTLNLQEPAAQLSPSSCFREAMAKFINLFQHFNISAMPYILFRTPAGQAPHGNPISSGCSHGPLHFLRHILRIACLEVQSSEAIGDDFLHRSQARANHPELPHANDSGYRGPGNPSYHSLGKTRNRAPFIVASVSRT